MALTQQCCQLPGFARAWLLVKWPKHPKDFAHLSLGAQQALNLVQQLPLSRYGRAWVAPLPQAGCCCCHQRTGLH